MKEGMGRTKAGPGTQQVHRHGLPPLLPWPLSPAATEIKPSEHEAFAQVVHSWGLGSELVNSVLEPVTHEQAHRG